MALTIIALAILAAVTVSGLRVIALPAARRIVRETPQLAIATLAGGAVAIVAVVLAARASPAVLPVLAAAAGLGWLAFWWRARPAFGRRRGLPPGSLSLRSSLDALVERTFIGRSFERYGPVFKMAQFHRPVACVLGLERGRELLRRHGDSLTPAPLGRDQTVPRGFVVSMAREDYDVYAPLFRRALAEAVSAVGRDVSARAAHDCCESLRAVPGTPAPAAREAIEDYVLSSLLVVYFGHMLHPDDRAVIDACCSAAGQVGIRGQPTRDARAAVERFGALIQTRGSVPEATADISFWTALLRLAPGAADDPTVVGNLCHLLENSRNNISGLVSWTAWFLAQDPHWLDVVRDQGQEDLGRSDPATAAVLETLRLAQSEYVYRCVVRPVDVEGFTVPQGWLVRICAAESHLLDPPFANPLLFDPARHIRTRFGPSEFAPFGLDAHGCLGARLSLELARSFVVALAGYTPMIEEIGPPARGTRHWSHWSIGSDFRLGLEPRGVAPAQLVDRASGETFPAETAQVPPVLG